MGNNNIEKLLQDLKNLPKQFAPEDFEYKLLERISLYENRKSSGVRFTPGMIRFNPIYATAFTMIIVIVLIVYSVQNNRIETVQKVQMVEKAVPEVQSQDRVDQVQPQKINVPAKKDFVVRRSKLPLNLGPGVSLDEPELSNQNQPSRRSTFIGYPLDEEAITIRIPPPNVLFNQEIENFNIFQKEYKDSIRLTKTKKK